ncbi:MAG TPA: phosphate acyltransferase PlsX [Candidatus Kapabacteria bacterium]|nr:phosphate acyltransferase PlsX [Candidatus Kapabacteria bacterium]
MPIVRVGLDTMGADFSPANEAGGALLASKELRNRVKVVLFGSKQEIEKALANESDVSQIEIVDTTEVITMHDEPVAALKQKRNSSLVRGLMALKNGEIDAFVSIGNTGAVMSGATLELGRIKGVSRPMIGAQFPRPQGGFTLVFDVGATVDAKPHWLKEYGIMGSIYAEKIFGVPKPSVALLSVGEERSKGNELVLEAGKLLDETDLNFIGNVEGRDILGGGADVVLCDGYTGNVLLKFAESVLTVLRGRIRSYSEKGFINKLKAAVTASVMRASLKDFDYQEHGGVPLLGVNGVVIIGHGSSSPKAIRTMIVRAEEMVNKNVVGVTRSALAVATPDN